MAEGEGIRYTRFERARIIGARALQISMGAPPLLAVHSEEAINIAIEEYEGGLIPMTINRVMYARH